MVCSSQRIHLFCLSLVDANPLRSNSLHSECRGDGLSGLSARHKKSLLLALSSTAKERVGSSSESRSRTSNTPRPGSRTSYTASPGAIACYTPVSWRVYFVCIRCWARIRFHRLAPLATPPLVGSIFFSLGLAGFLGSRHRRRVHSKWWTRPWWQHRKL